MKLRKGIRVALVGTKAKGTILNFLDKKKKIVHVEFDDGIRANILRPLLKKAA